MQKNILITGGAGYVGSQTAKFFKQKGYNPVAFDNLSYGNSYAVKWGELIVGDLTNYEDINNAIKKTNPIAIVHCGACISVGESVNNPYKYYHNNTYGSLNLFKAMVENNVLNVIFSSTCSVHGVNESGIVDELSAKNPISPYAMSKLMTENMLKDFDKAHGLKSVILRYFNVSGADSDSEIGYDRVESIHLIPIILDVIGGSRDSLNVLGTDYPTPDGSAIRDYIHVEDLANAHGLALDYLVNNKQSNDFNLGTGIGYSVKEIVDTVKKITQNDFKVNFLDRRAGDPPKLVANSKKANEVLKWHPAYDDINKIVASAYAWHKVKLTLKK